MFQARARQSLQHLTQGVWPAALAHNEEERFFQKEIGMAVEQIQPGQSASLVLDDPSATMVLHRKAQGDIVCSAPINFDGVAREAVLLGALLENQQGNMDPSSRFILDAAGDLRIERCAPSDQWQSNLARVEALRQECQLQIEHNSLQDIDAGVEDSMLVRLQEAGQAQDDSLLMVLDQLMRSDDALGALWQLDRADGCGFLEVQERSVEAVPLAHHNSMALTCSICMLPPTAALRWLENALHLGSAMHLGNDMQIGLDEDGRVLVLKFEFNPHLVTVEQLKEDISTLLAVSQTLGARIMGLSQDDEDREKTDWTSIRAQSMNS